jgi:hypothetical protein
MSRFIALHCGEETTALLSAYPNAFLLLTQIAMRAKWKSCAITNMKAGEAFIGDWRKAGLRSPKAYEVAKKRLEKCGIARFQGGNKGTRAFLLNSTIFSISLETKGKPAEDLGGSQGGAKGNLGGTNHTEHTENTETQTPFALDGASSTPALVISWDASNGFTGITEADRQGWMEAYPAVNIPRQLAAASEWLKSNPAKRKKNIRRFITSWFSRQQETGGDIPSNPHRQTKPAFNGIIENLEIPIG